MLLTRLYLRNFRVFEQELDLALPPGLVGIYGVNGAGKSSLLESILWTLWGRARTAKEEIRTADVGGDCITEVEFEHEGHLYLIRRTLSGANATVRAQGHCDGLLLAEGARDTARYVHSVLGMDDGAFRASVFAEQKQLAAFSTHSPADRRKLVLQLLGITPLDAARDNARKEARSVGDQHQKLRAMLPDLEALAVSAADADAHAAAAETDATNEQQAAEHARIAAEAAAAELERLDAIRQRYDTLVAEGRGVRGELDAANASVAQLTSELQQLDAAALEVDALASRADGLEQLTEAVRGLNALVEARQALEAVPPVAEPPSFDEEAHQRVEATAAAAAAALANATGRRGALQAELQRAEEQARRSEGLSGEADCPLCGQALGAAFESVQQHRAEEVTAAEARLQEAEGELKLAQDRATEAKAALQRSSSARQSALATRQEWERTQARRADLQTGVDRAARALESFESFGSLGSFVGAGLGGVRGEDLVGIGSALDAPLDRLRELASQGRREAEQRRQAAATLERLRGRLERRPALGAQLETARARAGDAEQRVLGLRQRLRELSHDPTALQQAKDGADQARQRAREAEQRSRQAHAQAVQARTQATGEARRLAEATEQHRLLGELQSDAQHLARAADLLNAFRNTVVAAVGPRLAVQAAELFAELTDHEYDQLEVDPETYELQIRDGGRLYGLDRFSGSEVDLANLALRVAISEHVRFQTGGSVGLLVLDEVFGPLDEDRRNRMLLALERLRARFRQILVVTHTTEIKEQLPNAIEVLKQPGRRSTARLLHQ